MDHGRGKNIPYSTKFLWVKIFVVLQILMCEPYKFPTKILTMKFFRYTVIMLCHVIVH